MGAAGASAGVMAAGSVVSALGQYQAGVFNQAMSEYDAKQLDAMASDAINRGEEEAQKVGVQGRLFLGEQRAVLAGQGIDISSGTAADIQMQTLEGIGKDEATVRLNATREAMGIRTQAATTRAQGKMGLRAATYNAAGSLLTGGAQAISAASSAGAFSGGKSSGPTGSQVAANFEQTGRDLAASRSK